MAQLDVTVGVVGVGAMGGSIARGLVESGTIEAARLLACDPDPSRAEGLAALGARIVASARELLAEGPDVLVLAVKPQVIGSVMEEVADCCEGTLVVSIAAGVTTAAIATSLPAARVVRVMPNLPVQVRSGASTVCAGPRATGADVELVRELFAALGTACVVREDQLDAAGAVVGTAPAFFSLFVDALTRAGVRAGMPAQACRELLETTMLGCAEQLLSEGVHPRAYMERVTSPGGTTVAALRELEPLLVEGTEEAVDAALARTRELAGA